MSNNAGNKLPDVYGGLQKRLEAGLASSRSVLDHPGAKGDATESNWLSMLQSHLPMRYQAQPAFVIDSYGAQSDQLDIVIYDRQYTPELYNHDGQRVIPAESVYAVLEVKQELDKGNITYAGAKAASVRSLHRTSAPIIHAGGRHDPIQPSQILAGILTTESSWNPPLGQPFENAIGEREISERLDLGCCARGGSFEVIYGDEVTIEHSSREFALANFFMRLLKRLQSIGTVPAIDYQTYLAAFSE